ncbi:MAG: 30S ribosomal protein S6 [Bryobacter sp.]|nr:30S ribosomal protein S6 [Bryobacter sp.]
MSLRLYEEMFIVKPDSTDELIDPLVEQLTTVITEGGGKLESSEKLGNRRLAYQVGRYNEGFYILLKFEAPGEVIKEVERRLRVNDLVIKNLTVRLDEDMKWANKRKLKREKRLARRPQPVAAPAQPAAPGAAMPGAAIPGAAAPGAPAPVLPAEPAAPVPGAPSAGAPVSAPAGAPATAPAGSDAAPAAE